MAARKLAHILAVLVTVFALQGAMAADGASKPAATDARSVVANYARPLSFEANRGQTDEGVDFLARGAGYSVFLSHGEAVMVLQSGTSKPGSRIKWATVRMRPVGGNTSLRGEALEEQAGKSNYFIGNRPQQWHTNVPNYAKVRYRDVYPAVDLIYYGNQRQLEYDFVVAPGVDPGKIALEFQGAGKAKLDRSGDLVMRTGRR